jgi:hypothetical protein
VQFLVYNEFEQVFSAALIECWKNFRLYQVDSFRTIRKTRSSRPLAWVLQRRRLSGRFGSLLGVHGTLADRDSQIGDAPEHFIEGDRFTATEGQIVDEIVLPEP